jgi:DNA-binding NarL/FixJ family response regulator
MDTLKTFIVEDSVLILENLVAALEELSPVAVVGSADDESGAVSWLNAHAADCDLLIIDVFLKSGSGLGVLRAAAAMAGHVNAVVLTNYATPDMRRKCLGLGAAKVFDKSNEIDALVAYCAQLADDESSRRNNPILC